MHRVEPIATEQEPVQKPSLKLISLYLKKIKRRPISIRFSRNYFSIHFFFVQESREKENFMEAFPDKNMADEEIIVPVWHYGLSGRSYITEEKTDLF